MLCVRVLCFIGVCLAGFADAVTVMKPEDIVRLERPTQTVTSPDGMKVAYVVKRANIQENKNVETLYLWEANKTQTLWEIDHVRQLFWQDDSLYALGDQGQESQIIQVKGGSKQKILSSPQRIDTFSISRNGEHLYYSQSIFASEQAIQKFKEEGYVYRWGKDFSQPIQNSQYGHREWDEIIHWDRTSAKGEIITRLFYDQWLDAPIGDWELVSQLALSEDGKKLAIQCKRLGDPLKGECAGCSDIILWDLEKGSGRSLSPGLPILSSPCWISNQELCFIGTSTEKGQMSNGIYVWDLAKELSTQVHSSSCEIQCISWNREDQKLLIDEGKSISAIAWTTKQKEIIEFPSSLLHWQWQSSSYSFDLNLHRWSAIAEDAMTPPQVVLYDLHTKEMHPISSLNQDIQRFTLGKVETIHVKVDETLSATGYLIHPTSKPSKKKSPLILASYGFSGQTFLADAEWHSSFPAQTLAGEGYAVLLLNSPSRGHAQFLTGNSELARTYEGWDRLAIFEKAVDLLNERGLIDPTKVGIYGWSNGAFTVEFLISHSSKFHVAALGEGGDYNPAVWLSGHPARVKIYQNIFGALPWEKPLQSYYDFSPYFSIDKIQAPLLMEFANALGAYEMYVPLRYLNIPTELIIYDHEEHNFVRPKSRIASMQRKIDWFNYWLLGKKNPDKPDQSARWDQMAIDRENSYKKEAIE